MSNGARKTGRGQDRAAGSEGDVVQGAKLEGDFVGGAEQGALEEDSAFWQASILTLTNNPNPTP